MAVKTGKFGTPYQLVAAKKEDGTTDTLASVGLVATAVPQGLVDVTPANADLAGGICRGVLVTVAGNLGIITADGSAPTAFPVIVGQQLNVAIKRVLTTTTATVKAIY